MRLEHLLFGDYELGAEARQAKSKDDGRFRQAALLPVRLSFFIKDRGCTEIDPPASRIAALGAAEDL